MIQIRAADSVAPETVICTDAGCVQCACDVQCVCNWNTWSCVAHL